MLSLLPSPAGLPPLSLILADLGQPTPQAIATALGVSVAAARRWVRDDCAPRTVLLSLFWLTRWGRSDVHCRAENDARMQAGLARCLAEQVKAHEDRLGRLLRIADFGCANDAYLGVSAASSRPGSMASPPSQPAVVSAHRVTIPNANSHS